MTTKPKISVNLGYRYFGVLALLIILTKFVPHFLFTIALWVWALPLLAVAAVLCVLAAVLVLFGVLQVLIFILEIFKILKHGKYRVFKSKFLTIRK